MKANPDKFQAICIGKKSFEKIKSFNIGSVEIKCEENVKGVDINSSLNFDAHLSKLCRSERVSDGV